MHAWIALLNFLTIVFLCPSASAVDFSQSVNLRSGWNSIWLSVEPQDDDGNPKTIEAVFPQTNVSIVATLFKPVGTADFATLDGAAPFNQETWGVWRRDSALQENTLATMPGNRGYLIYVKGAVNAYFDGQAVFQRPTWQPDSFNLVGFDLLGTPNFDELLGAASDRHPINKIFKLLPTGKWTAVQGSDTMSEDVAYMIYANGRSDFMGAVRVRSGRSLDFGVGPGTIEVTDPDPPGDPLLLSKGELTFSNPTATTQTVRISQADAGDNYSGLKLYALRPDTNALDWTVGSGRIDDTGVAFAINPGTSKTISLGALRDQNYGATNSDLFRIELGTHFFWLPATAENDLLQGGFEDDDPAYVGLWVGDAVVNRVTSVTEATRPETATSSKVPLRILIHVDSSGKP